MATAVWLPHAEAILEIRPPDLWPLVLRWEQWIRDYRVEHLSGSRDAVGEKKRISFLDSGGKSAGHFQIEVVQLIPNKRLACRILPLEEAAFGYEKVEGFEIFSLYDLGGRTLLTYQTVARLESSLMSQQEFDAHVRQNLETGARAWQEKYWPELRRQLKLQV